MNANGSKKGRPADVSKFFAKELRYGGAPTEPLCRRFKTFKNAVDLCEVDVENTDIMFPLIETSFLTGQALLEFQNVIRETAAIVGEVIDLLEAHFLGHRAKRVNDDVWDELSYQLVASKRKQEGKSATHEDILGDLLDQVADLADIRTGPGCDSIIMAKSIAAVRLTYILLYVRIHLSKCKS